MSPVARLNDYKDEPFRERVEFQIQGVSKFFFFFFSHPEDWKQFYYRLEFLDKKRKKRKTMRIKQRKREGILTFFTPNVSSCLTIPIPRQMEFDKRNRFLNQDIIVRRNLGGGRTKREKERE